MANSSSNSLLRAIIGSVFVLVVTLFFQQLRPYLMSNDGAGSQEVGSVVTDDAKGSGEGGVAGDLPRPNRPPQPLEEGNELNQTLSSQRVHYTKHARCRMDCRHISEAEVLEILHRGKENRRKSDPNAPECPKYALEGVTKDKQRVRMIFADCDNETRVITVIDLDNEHHCNCK